MKRILTDAGRCSGCRLCEMVCSFEKEKTFAPSASRITVLRDDSLGLDLPIVCWHCNPCRVIEICPQEALERDKEGVVRVNEGKCVGCAQCLETCTIGAIKLHPKKNTAQLCDQCGGKPLCIQKCPTKALAYVETEEDPPRLPDQILKETVKGWGISA